MRDFVEFFSVKDVITQQISDFMQIITREFFILFDEYVIFPLHNARLNENTFET